MCDIIRVLLRFSRLRIALSIGIFVVYPLTTPLPVEAAVIAGFDDQRHVRYLSGGQPNPGFLINESLITGLGGRAALVTPRHVVTAAHADPAEFTFRGNDGIRRTYNSSGLVDLLTTFIDENGDTVTRASDIRLHTLTEAVDPAITPIAIATGNPLDWSGREFFLLGNHLHGGRVCLSGAIDTIQAQEYASLHLLEIRLTAYKIISEFHSTTDVLPKLSIGHDV